MNRTRLQFVVGKGGVGKSTVAAAEAAAAARDGEHVLTVSLDQAHSLRDVFGLDAAACEVRVPGAAGCIELEELDTLALAGERWDALTRVAGIADGQAGGAGLFADELTVLPGVQEMAGLAAVADRVEGRRFDRVVVDCGPTADALRLLELPSAVSNSLERMWPRHRRLGRPPANGRMYLAVGLAEQADALAARIDRLVRDRSRTCVTAVTADLRVALAEARRGVTALALSGLAPREVVVNRCRAGEPSPAAGEFSRQAGVPVLTLPDLDAEPVGVDALARVGERLRSARGGAGSAAGPAADSAGPAAAGSATAPAGPGAVARESGQGLDAVYALDLTLPMADPAQVTLGRVGDDLIVGAAGVRRRVRLAPVLRRCAVRGADFRDGRLRVRFTPDPEVWPR